MLLAAPGGRSIDGRSRVAVSAIATARAIALLTAVFFSRCRMLHARKMMLLQPPPHRR